MDILTTSMIISLIGLGLCVILLGIQEKTAICQKLANHAYTRYNGHMIPKRLKLFNKDDRKAGEILLYLSRCADACKKIPTPEGIQLEFKVSSSTKPAAKRLKVVEQITIDTIRNIDDIVDRAARKKKK